MIYLTFIKGKLICNWLWSTANGYPQYNCLKLVILQKFMNYLNNISNVRLSSHWHNCHLSLFRQNDQANNVQRPTDNRQRQNKNNCLAIDALNFFKASSVLRMRIHKYNKHFKDELFKRCNNLLLFVCAVFCSFNLADG